MEAVGRVHPQLLTGSQFLASFKEQHTPQHIRNSRLWPLPPTLHEKASGPFHAHAPPETCPLRPLACPKAEQLSSLQDALSPAYSPAVHALTQAPKHILPPPRLLFWAAHPWSRTSLMITRVARPSRGLHAHPARSTWLWALAEAELALCKQARRGRKRQGAASAWRSPAARWRVSGAGVLGVEGGGPPGVLRVKPRPGLGPARPVGYHWHEMGWEGWGRVWGGVRKGGGVGENGRAKCMDPGWWDKKQGKNIKTNDEWINEQNKLIGSGDNKEIDKARTFRMMGGLGEDTQEKSAGVRNPHKVMYEPSLCHTPRIQSWTKLDSYAYLKSHTSGTWELLWEYWMYSRGHRPINKQ